MIYSMPNESESVGNQVILLQTIDEMSYSTQQRVL
jgi:hypothetical protein